MAWTRFMDMHSGGGTKTDFEYIYIEALTGTEAIEVFEKEFEQNPYDVACECCGENFSISTYETLEEATEYERRWSKETTLELYVRNPEVRVIYAHVGNF